MASLANLDKLPEEARKAMQGLGATVRATLVTALSKALIVAEKVVKSRWPKKSNGDAQTSGYTGQASDIKRWSVPTGAKAETHTLHATTGNDNPTGTSGQSANANTNNNAPATGAVIYRGVKEVTLDKQLHEWNEQTKEKDSELKKKIQAAVSHLKEKLNPLVNAIAKAFKNFNTKLEALKKMRDNKDSKPQQITTAEGESASALASLANAQQAAEPALQQQATLVQACEADAAGCFAAGTKLWTPQGYQNVEDLREGDLVYSRNEYAPSGVVEAKPIEQVFRRLAEVVHLHLRGPNSNLATIRTTGEHPFYAFDKGWMPVKELTAEDWVLTEAGEWAKVEEVFATSEMEVVYNLRVAEWHTYFVGDEGWGWTAWAHNNYAGLVDALNLLCEDDFGKLGIQAKSLVRVANHNNTHEGWQEFQAQLKKAQLNIEQLRDLWWVARAPDNMTLQQARAVFTQSQNQAVSVLSPLVQKIVAALLPTGIDDLSFGIRGSLATGWSFDKVNDQDGRPWDANYFDIDAFVKSSKLALLIPGNSTASGGSFISLADINRADGFKTGEANSSVAVAVQTLIRQAGTNLAATFSKRLKPGTFAFKVFRGTASVSGITL